MNTSLVSLSLLAASLAFAAPAAAECSFVEPTGASLCAELDDPSGRSLSAYQPGLGGAGYSSSEFSFGGTTYRNSAAYVFVGTDLGAHFVSVSEFCMAQGGECTLEEHTVSYYGEHGYATAQLIRMNGERWLCYGAPGTYECVAL